MSKATILPGLTADWDAFHYNQRRRVEIHSLVCGTGPQRFAESAEALAPYLRAVRDAGRSAAVLGSGWSLSDLIGWDGQMLATDGFDCLAWATSDQQFPQPEHAEPRRLVFAGGGVKGYRLVEFLEREGWSLRTSGSYLGQSLAGSIATGVNGSRLGYGGFQNQVRGLHLVTRDDHSVWIEPASRPALRDETAALFAQEIIRDDAVFADVLVHLGGMGFVNGILIEAVPSLGFQVLTRKQTVDADWLELVRDSKFAELPAWLGIEQAQRQQLAYYEVQLDPFDWDNAEAPHNSEALHTMYFQLTGADRPSLDEGPDLPRVQGGLGPVLRGQDAPWQIENLYHAYKAKFVERSPADGPGRGYSWGALHREPPEETWRPLIYSAALSIEQCNISRAIPAMCKMIREMEFTRRTKMRHLIFTLRFVHEAAGTMAFTRWPDSVVIDLEGVMDASGWLADPSQPPVPTVGAESAAMALTALEREGIPYTQHWGKYTPLGRMSVAREFGPGEYPQSPLARWRKTRARLLKPEWQPVFMNAALANWEIC